MKPRSENNSDFKLMAAPLQGLTEAPFRHYHAALYRMPEKERLAYFTPFVRMEHGAPRVRDMRDVTSTLNAGQDVNAQVIARDGVEFRALVDAIALTGNKHIDLNAGCPFPPQVHKGRGAGLLSDPSRLEEIALAMTERSDLHYSIKMRLGTDAPEQWRSCADIINSMPLTHVTIHPRTAREQYSGKIHYGEFEYALGIIRHPVIYNGEIATPHDIADLRARYPELGGVMAGRGLLRRPSLFIEYVSGEEWTELERCSQLIRLHEALSQYYSSILCGDTQILTKLKPFWEYFGLSFPRKLVKQIEKSHSVRQMDLLCAELWRRFGGNFVSLQE